MAVSTSTESISSGPLGPVFQIIPGVQSYDWGKLARDGSLVAQFAEATEGLDFHKEDDKPYAELWMGTHPTLPSTISVPSSSKLSSTTTNESQRLINLSSYLEEYPSLVGKQVQDHFFNGKANLPFLFKVLSIGKALSIQAHPDKTLARKLHKEKPKMYRDDNHKPEMAIALTAFKGFCGFRPLKEIAHYLSVVPEFQAVVKPSKELMNKLTKYVSGGDIDESEKKKTLRQIFSQLMEADSSEVEKSVHAISKRYNEQLEGGSKEAIEVDETLAKLVCKLNDQFPGDIGVFCSFLLNVVELQEGQSMFLMANEPHAYLEGEIIECMAASDNVVRAGLTPKERDVKVLVDMLTYTDDPSYKKLMKAKAFLPDESSENLTLYQNVNDNGKVPTLLYNPPIEEFAVLMSRLSKEQPSELQRALQGPSVLLLTSGSGKLISHSGSDGTGSEHRTFDLSKPGQVFFVGAQTKIELQATDSDFVVFRAFVEIP
ncbi:hypothetical protein CBS101457_003331 [Exobasidium rhododendri]|nr:hypothetical protein CBS101457_003331 [Exobasidium rhododendri]